MSQKPGRPQLIPAPVAPHAMRVARCRRSGPPRREPQPGQRLDAGGVVLRPLPELRVVRTIRRNSPSAVVAFVHSARACTVLVANPLAEAAEWVGLQLNACLQVVDGRA
jgi:hypothetical protein